MGSSHGITRIIRMAYFEHPGYVPLLRRSYALWRELQEEAGEQLLYITGSIDAGPPDSRNYQGSPGRRIMATTIFWEIALCSLLRVPGRKGRLAWLPYNTPATRSWSWMQSREEPIFQLQASMNKICPMNLTFLYLAIGPIRWYSEEVPLPMVTAPTLLAVGIGTKEQHVIWRAPTTPSVMVTSNGFVVDQLLGAQMRPPPVPRLMVELSPCRMAATSPSLFKL
jgi:hypothetical protein